MSFENVSAKATLKIECGDSRGSGFHFEKKEIIATNFHVIEVGFAKGQKILAKTDSGNQAELKLLAYSPQEEYDYAILKINGDLKEDRVALEPKIVALSRGMQVCFGGFPSWNRRPISTRSAYFRSIWQTWFLY